MCLRHVYLPRSAHRVETNFGQYGDWLKKVRAAPGQPFVVPVGRAAGTSVEQTTGSEGQPPVLYQADMPLCATYGLVSAFRFVGCFKHAKRLEDCAVELSGRGTHQVMTHSAHMHTAHGRLLG